MKKILSMTVICAMLACTPAYAEISKNDNSVIISGYNENLYEGNFASVAVTDMQSEKIVFYDDFEIQEDGNYEFESFSLEKYKGLRYYKADILLGNEKETEFFVNINGTDDEIFESAYNMNAEYFAECLDEFAEYFGLSELAEKINEDEKFDFAKSINNKLSGMKKENLQEESEKTLMIVIAKNRVWSSIKDSFERDFNISGRLSGYKNLTEAEKQKLYVEIAGKSYSSYNDMISDMKNYIKNLGNNKTTGSSSGGSSSGGSGGSLVSATGTPEIFKPSVSVSETKFDFTDVNKEFWAYEEICAMRDMNIINGNGNGNFRPDDFVSRSEFVKMVASILDIRSNKKSVFDDVYESDWYFEYVQAAYENKIITGDGNRFNPNDNITRQDMAVIIARILDKYNVNAEVVEIEYSDADEISDYAEESVKKLTSLKIMSGYPDNTFKPFGNATRAESTKTLYSLYDLIKNK